MGQRLVLTIKEDATDIAKIYYHWSGYTESAYEEVIDLYNMYRELDDTNLTIQQKLLISVNSNGGGLVAYVEDDHRLPNESWDDYKNRIEPLQQEKLSLVLEQYQLNDYYNPSAEISRNRGLIAFDEYSMEDLESWSELSLTVDFKNGTVSQPSDAFVWIRPEEIDDVLKFYFGLKDGDLGKMKCQEKFNFLESKLPIVAVKSDVTIDELPTWIGLADNFCILLDYESETDLIVARPIG